jgi:hypothetical protein
VRGFAPWAPRAATRELLDRVQGVFGEYRDYLPLTIRQIFYRLVGRYEYEKTERAYERLCEHLNRARRARLIPMSAIRDDGTTIARPNAWDSVEQFVAVVCGMGDRFVLDRTVGQKTRLVVVCEAAGMVLQLARVADPYGITVMSSGGFESTTDKYRFAKELAGHDRPTEALSIGDHDASGVSMFLAFLEDVEAFTRDLGGECAFTRLAVTPTQIEELSLPTAPPKASDRRAFNGETCQAEAIAPDVLSASLRVAIEERIDRDIYLRVLRREQRERRQLVNKLKGL